MMGTAPALLPTTLLALALLAAAAADQWVKPQGFPAAHNGGFLERLQPPSAGHQPHILMVLFDDYGWADAGWHRNYTGPGGVVVPATDEVQTPTLNGLVKSGIELDRNYVYKYCSPTRSALQSGRNPYHVNPLNAEPEISNPADPVSGFAAVPRNMTGIATKLAAAGYRTAAFGMNNTCHGGQPAGGQPKACLPGPEGDHWWGGYEDSLFEQHVLATITEHDPATPLFVFWAPHIVHSPLQVPQKFIDKFSFIKNDKPSHSRQLYHAMVNFADEVLGNITAAYKAKGMYDDLLIVFSTDNGGPIYGAGGAGANNFPLKGGKMNNWDGGIRGNGFISGGFVPEHLRGSKFEGLVTAWDWYHTFASLAGVDATDHRAKAASLPPIDSYDMSGVITGKTTKSPRTEIPIGTEPRASNVTSAPLCSSYGSVAYYEDPRIEGDEIAQPPGKGKCTTVSGLIVDGPDGLWKILTGTVEQACYTGPHYPNTSTLIPSSHYVQDCGNGCLYELKSDPLETTNLAEHKPAKLKELYQKLVEYEKTAFNPHRGNSNPQACKHAFGKYGGFWGPFLE